MNFAFSRAFLRAFVVRSLCFLVVAPGISRASYFAFSPLSLLCTIYCICFCAFARDAMRYVYIGETNSTNQIIVLIGAVELRDLFAALHHLL